MDDAPRIRRAEAGDVPALADLYEASVRALGPEGYDADQVRAWATFARAPAGRRGRRGLTG